MENRFAHLAASIATLFALTFAAVPAFADAKTEGDAKKLEKKAMEEDYLATDFDKALEKLNQASSKCGTDKCSPALRAQLKSDIGVVQVAGKSDRAAGIAAFQEALKIDPNAQLNADLTTKEVQSAWDEAKGKPGAAPKSAPSGDFKITPAPEQLVRTPVPIFVEYGGSEELAKVVAKYKGFGMTEWKTLEMKKLGPGYGIEVPCVDVVQGDLQYYIQGFNANNDPVATSGDRNTPYKTVVKREKLDGEAPHLPGQEPPTQCADKGDCPPDFPGCKGGAAAATESTLKGEGEDCEEDSECKSNTCNKDKTCAGGTPDEQPKKLRRVWIGVEGELDFLSIGSATDVCHLDPVTAQPTAAGYYCVDGDGNDYPLRTDGGAQNKLIQLGKSDKVQGGIAPGNIRVLLSFDYALNANMLVGARLGYVINRYPGSAGSNDGKTFAPVHGEARFTYVIGKDALAKAGVAPFLYLGGGVSQWDSSVNVSVIETGTAGAKQVSAWSVNAPAFMSLGGGVRYAVSNRFAMTFGPRFSLIFGGGGGMAFAASPELGAQMGF